MLEPALKKVIPSELNSFNKLTKGRTPYYFTAWDEIEGVSILRYWFWNKTKTKKNKKRVFVSEIETLLKHMQSADKITRGDYRQSCPRTNGDGTCGFAVIIWILEYFQVVKIVDDEYHAKRGELIKQLLA